jgi:quercetin dioxygenase-like cupin family protein
MKYFYQLDSMEKHQLVPGMTSASRATVEGEQMFVGLAHKPRGTGSRPHSHPIEQFNYVLKGVLKAKIGDEEALVGPGGLMHIPANTIHTIVATPEEDVIFLVVKDKHKEYEVIPADGDSTAGPRYEPGFEPVKS